MRFIDDLYDTYDVDAFNIIIYKKVIYQPELELNVLQEGSNATFFDLDVTLLDG